MAERTPLGKTDPDQIAAFWTRFCAASDRPATPQPEAWPFGDSVELADELLALVLQGPKRATAGSVDEFEYEGQPLPSVGDLEIVTDGSMRPQAVLELTDVRIGPMSSVDDAFAWDEGEGDRSRSSWVEAHTQFFTRFLPTIGQVFDPDMATIFQRFDLIYQE